MTSLTTMELPSRVWPYSSTTMFSSGVDLYVALTMRRSQWSIRSLLGHYGHYVAVLEHVVVPDDALRSGVDAPDEIVPQVRVHLVGQVLGGRAPFNKKGVR